MLSLQRKIFPALTCGLLIAATASGQPLAPAPAGQQQQLRQPAPPPAAGAIGQPALPQAPPGFQLNPLEQAFLDQVLDAWQNASSKVTTFDCPFQRQEFDPAFGPGRNAQGHDIPLIVNTGELTFKRPDKASFQITEVRRWQANPATPGAQPPAAVQGNWVKQPDAIGEHWVCTGKSVFEYRHNQKQVVERPIPPQLQGQAIVDGPLPFLFGADANKIKARFWLRIIPSDDKTKIWIHAEPKWQADAANYKAVDVMLDQNRVLPTDMNIVLPNGGRHLYFFDLGKASINNPIDRLAAILDRGPSTPMGWKKVVEQMPPDQAAQPAPLQR